MIELRNNPIKEIHQARFEKGKGKCQAFIFSSSKIQVPNKYINLFPNQKALLSLDDQSFSMGFIAKTWGIKSLPTAWNISSLAPLSSLEAGPNGTLNPLFICWSLGDKPPFYILSGSTARCPCWIVYSFAWF